MLEKDFLESIKPDHIFDGGDLDCGSGLVLLLRENMMQVPVGGILEMRSREATVADDLPPWCRMVGHDYLGKLDTSKYARYFIRKKSHSKEEEKNLKGDKNKAKLYEWRARTRSTGHLKSTVYFRNFSFDVGQPASFEEKDKYPSAIEYLIGSLSASLSTGFITESSMFGLQIDDIEISVRCKLNNILAHLGIEEGDPSIALIELKCFISTMEDENKVKEVWNKTLKQSPVLATLSKSTEIIIKMNVV